MTMYEPIPDHRCIGETCPTCDERGRLRANARLAVLTEEERKAFEASYAKWQDEKWPLQESDDGNA